MRVRHALRVGVVTLLFLSYLPTLANATNGSLLIGYGAKSRGMGGVGVALPADSLTSAVNPAGVAFTGTRGDIGGMLFNPSRSAWVPGFSGKPNQRSGATLFAIPNMGATMKFDRTLSLGFGFVGSGGGNTRYSDNFFDFAGEPDPTLGVNLAQAVMSPTVAYKFTKNHSLGVSLLLGVQTFRAYGLSAFADAGFSARPGSVSNRGNEYSYGAGGRVGWLSKFMKGKIAVGATASSKVYMTRFSKYDGLFAKDGKFDMPATLAVGVAVKPMKKLTLAADVQRILYSQIDAISNPGPVRFLPLPPDDELLGAKNGLGFGWSSLTVYKVGADYEYNKKWSFRAGYNYAKSPIKDDQLLANTLAPAVVEHHVTLGLTYRPTKNSELTLAGMYAFRNDQVGFDNFSGDNIRVSMDQRAIDFGYGIHF